MDGADGAPGPAGEPGPAGPAGTSGNVVEYLFSSNTATPPGAGQLRFNNSNQTLATRMYLDGHQATGEDVSTLLKLVKTGIGIYIQDKDDSTRWQDYDLTAAPIDGGSYVEFPVVWNQGGLAVPEQRANIVFIAGGNYAPAVPSINAQTGTSYTLVADDNGKIVTMSNAAAITLTVPSGLGAGFSCLIVQLAAGKITPTASGTTIVQRQSFTKTAGQYAVASLVAYVANTFVLSGDLIA